MQIQDEADLIQIVDQTFLENDVRKCLSFIPYRESIVFSLYHGILGFQPHTISEIQKIIHLPKNRILSILSTVRKRFKSLYQNLCKIS